MKISIITVVWNNKATIKDAIDSVLSQTHKDIEYIIIDGASSDGTIEIVKSYGDKITKFVSEPDKGLYDAMNKGISLCSGDVVGILNSDDFYIDEFVISKVVKEFEDKKCDSVYADLVFVKPENLDKTVRYYDSSHFTPSKFAYGWMPAHPTFFVKKETYDKYGVFRTDLRIGADFDILARFLYTQKISYSYMKEVFVKMRVGGVSTGGIKATWLIVQEQLQVCKDNGIDTNIFKIMSKYPKKLLEFIKR
jgi:glycosyltransferase involved in cell wall biosynthesis